MHLRRTGPSLFLLIAVLFSISAAQTTSFTFQGDLELSGQPANGSFDLEFRLYDAGSGGSQIGATETRSNVAVADGRFTVLLDFGANFSGPDRFIEIRVRQAGGGGFTLLDPRQRIGSSPYAVRSISANTATNAVTAVTADNALQLGGVAANQYVVTTDPRMTNARPPTAGSESYIQNTNTEQNSANFNINGDGRARNFNAVNGYNLNGVRYLWSPGTDNLFAGIGAGMAGPTGTDNAFFGRLAGSNITSGSNNAFFGSRAGLSNNSGSNHSFFGGLAGRDSATGSDGNTFIGWSAGLQTTNGSGNTFIGRGSGTTNTIGSGNTLLGSGTFLGAANLTYASAIGADSTVSESSTIVLGRSGGQDKVVIPGQLITNLPISTNTVNATTQYNLGGNRILISTSGPASNMYLGPSAGPATEAGGGDNIFIGRFAGFQNAGGNSNTFVGVNSGDSNTLGDANAFFGYNSGSGNTTGDGNAFFGSSAGFGNTQGLFNSNFGNSSGSGNSTGSHNANFGNGAGFLNNGSNNSVFGSDAGRTLTAGASNSFFGREAATSQLSGNENAYFGARAGRNLTSGTRNSFFGFEAGLDQNGTNLTMIGAQAQSTANNLSFATAIGAGATVSTSNTIVLGRPGGQDGVNIPGNLTVTGSTSLNAISATIVNATAQFNLGGSRVLGAPGTDNTFVGLNTGTATTGAANTFVGRGAGELTTTGSENSIFGRAAGLNNTTGSENSFFGRSAGLENIAGNQNAFFGRNAGRNTNANGNTMVGYDAGKGNTVGTNNTALGLGAGVTNVTGSNNTFIGAGADAAITGNSYATAIGAGAIVQSSNTISLGRSVDRTAVNGNLDVAGTTDFIGRVTIFDRLRFDSFGPPAATALCVNALSEVTICGSSIRFKTNVSAYSYGLSLIKELRPVYFDWKHSGVRDFGLVAEEVAAVEPLLATTNMDGDIQGVNYDRIGVVLVNAVNEQQAEIDRLRADSERRSRQIEQLLDANRRQQAQIEALIRLSCAANTEAKVCREKP